MTQGGSSGSPLIDTTTHRVVGVLTGGLSTCQTAQSPDYYGRLSRVGAPTVLTPHPLLPVTLQACTALWAQHVHLARAQELPVDRTP